MFIHFDKMGALVLIYRECEFENIVCPTQISFSQLFAFGYFYW